MFKNAILFGIILIVIGNIVGYILSKSKLSVDLPIVCNSWNDFYIMELSLFLSGIISHLLLNSF